MTQLTQSKRKEVLDAYGHECAFCGMTEKEHEEERGRSLDIHHIIPRRADGSNKPENLISVCISCHKTLESTQADALERIEFNQTEKQNYEEKIAELENEKEGLEKELSDTTELYYDEENQHSDSLAAIIELLQNRINITIYAVHETRFATSRLLYVGCDEDKAIKAFKESENHATMETATVSSDHLSNISTDDIDEIENESKELASELRETKGMKK